MAAGRLILCVIDALAPGALSGALAAGGVPTIARLIEHGRYVDECVAAFPSVTPVCAAAIATGEWQDRHGVPGMNWYDRSAGRYVEYGSSFRSARRFGIARQLTDTVYNLNQAHLSPQTPTIFEQLDDAGVRTAATTYLVYRGRHVHEPSRLGLLPKLAAPLARHPVLGPQELFYADLFASRPAPCAAILGMPGVRDRHSSCVGAYLAERDLFDFLLLSLPDNDWYSHRHGPDGQMRSLALSDQHLARVLDAAGGVDEFLAEGAVIVMGDHAHVPVDHAIDLSSQLRDLGVLEPGGDADGAALAVCPSQRAAMVYVLREDERERLAGEVRERALALEGVELAAWVVRDVHGAPTEAALAGPRTRELRFAPGGELTDARGETWSIEGDRDVLGLREADGLLDAPLYPDALARLWAALACERSGDVLLSAAPRFEFLDWGGQAHRGGGSHGSLRAGDSLTGLVMAGVAGPDAGHG
ncbi:MAG: alkaline phosphatase family protein, partial [Acidobacteriota bacterium]|nr:alkaline phosphatase family protein [Acidobacteriota bacterium]